MDKIGAEYKIGHKRRTPVSDCSNPARWRHCAPVITTRSVRWTIRWAQAI